MPVYQPMLPGLDPAPEGSGPLERAAHATLAALGALELLRDDHALLCALIVTTAQDIDREHRLTVAKANMRGLLAELRDKLPEPAAQTDDRWSAIERELQALEQLGATA